MNPLALFRLLRLRDLLGFAGICMMFAIGFGYCFYWLRLALSAPVPIPISANTAALLLSLGYMAGSRASAGLEKARDLPGTWILPNSGRLFAFWHVLSFWIIAGVLTALGPLWAAELPWPSRLGWALFAQALHPPGDRPANTPRLWLWTALGGFAVFLLVGTFSPELAAWSRLHAGITLLIGLIGAGISQWAWRRRELVRSRSATRVDVPAQVRGIVLVAAGTPLPNSPGPARLGRGVDLRLGREFGLILGLSALVFFLAYFFFGRNSMLAGIGLTIVATSIYLTQKVEGLRPRACREPISRRERLRRARGRCGFIALGTVFAAALFQLAGEAGASVRLGGGFAVSLKAPLETAAAVLLLLPLAIGLNFSCLRRIASPPFGAAQIAIGVLCAIGMAVNAFWPQFLKSFRWTEHGPALLGAFAVFLVLCDLSLRQYFLRADLPTGSGRA